MTGVRVRARVRMTAIAALVLAAGVTAWGVPPQASAQEDPPASPESVVLFIADLSGSMNEPFGDGRTKLDVAKAGFRVYLQGVNSPVGLRVYGDQLPAKPPAARQENCETDTRLIQPVEEGNNEALVSTVDGFTARGDTPIALALQEAAKNDIPEGALATIVLFSDGRDECHDADLDGDPSVGPSWGPDPCNVARDIAERGIDLRIDKINTIGFQAADSEEQLRCISGVTGGEHRNVETEEDLRGALNELGDVRSAERLGGDPIDGTPTAEGAPILERIAPGENNRRYTDTIGMNEERWYLAPEYGPGSGHTTVTFFDLPKQEDVREGITMEFRWEPGPDENLRLNIDQSDTPDPISASDSLRCGGCHIVSSDSHAVYWVVALRSEDPNAGGEYDIELLLQDSAWGGPDQGCLEGNKCWYESQLDAAEERKAQLEEELRGPEDLRPVQDEIGNLDAELTSLQSQRDTLEAGPEETTNWLLPILLGVLAVLGAVSWVALARRNPTMASATSAPTSQGPGTAVIGTIDLGGAGATDDGSSTAPAAQAGTGTGEFAGDSTSGDSFGEPGGMEPDAHPGGEAGGYATEAPAVDHGPPMAGREVPDAAMPPEPGREVPEADVPPAEPGREVPEAGSGASETPAGSTQAAVSAPTELPTEATATIPAGWFDDPNDPSQWRWWDGTAWTDHVARKE